MRHGVVAAGTAGSRPGTLKVFLGAAPGVGKTYRMLDEGRRRARRGTDVVVGFAECHKRRYTGEMLKGLETVPRAAREYRGALTGGPEGETLIRRAARIADRSAGGDLLAPAAVATCCACSPGAAWGTPSSSCPATSTSTW